MPVCIKQAIACVIQTDGTIEFLGRLDRQVKVRGFRLELGEIEALPLNDRAKSDRQMLAAPELDRSDLDNVFIAPRNSIATEIARIFGEVLNLVGVASLQENRVGVDDDFFELGGHSLLATKLIARLLSSFEVQLTSVDRTCRCDRRTTSRLKAKNLDLQVAIAPHLTQKLY